MVSSKPFVRFTIYKFFFVAHRFSPTLLSIYNLMSFCDYDTWFENFFELLNKDMFLMGASASD